MTTLDIAKWMNPKGELAAGHMRVPWLHWDQWNFVKESLFSNSPELIAAALQRVAAWRSRGCLPIAIQVSAAIIETQQRDIIFSEELFRGTVDSEETLAMLYSMAITRFVNGFVEKLNNFDQRAQKYASEKKQSVHELADAIGIPRMLVDIRHESSHRDLPSLPILRLASTKALEWLKRNYWESQRKMIPDVRNEVVSRLYQLVYCIKAKSAGKSVPKNRRRAKQLGPLFVSNKLSSLISAKLLTSKNSGFDKLISKTVKVIMRLYSLYPMEVVSSLLGIYMLQTPASSSTGEVDGSNSPNPDVSDRSGAIDYLRVIIAKLSREGPGFVMALLKEVLRMIEASGSFGDNEGYFVPESERQTEAKQLEHLSSLFLWLLNCLKQLKECGRFIISGDSQQHLTGKDYISKFSLKNLLHKCLLLSASGNTHIVDSALLLAEISGSLLTEKLRRLCFVNLNHLESVDQDHSDVNSETVISRAGYLEKATLDLDVIKSRIQASTRRTSEINGTYQSNRRWALAKSWTPCPIGMLPCSLGISPVLPNLDVVGFDECDENRPVMEDNVTVKAAVSNKREADSEPVSPGFLGLSKKLKGGSEGFQKSAVDYVAIVPIEGRLLVNGVWTKIGEEELEAIALDVKILVK